MIKENKKKRTTPPTKENQLTIPKIGNQKNKRRRRNKNEK